MTPFRKTKFYLYIENIMTRYKVRKRLNSAKEFFTSHMGIFKGLFFGALLLYLIIGNWGNIISPPDAAIGYKEIAKQVLLTKVNLQIMASGAMYAIATGAVFLLRLPFLKIESLKVPGFEYKTQAEKQEAIAEVNMEQFREFESARLAFLQTCEDPDIIQSFYDEMNGASFDIFLTSDLLARNIENYFMDNLDMELPAKVILVQNGEITDEDQFYHESPLVRNLILEVLASGESTFDKKTSHSAIAVPLTIEEYPENQCILYAETVDTEIVLGAADCKMVEIYWSQIKRILSFKYLNELLEERTS